MIKCYTSLVDFDFFRSSFEEVILYNIEEQLKAKEFSLSINDACYISNKLNACDNINCKKQYNSNIKCKTIKTLSNANINNKKCLNSELLVFNPLDNSMFHTHSHQWVSTRCFNSIETIPKILGSTKFFTG